MADEQNQQANQSSQAAGDQQSQSQQGAAQNAGSTSNQETGGAATTVTRPDWLPETFFDPKSGPKVDDIKKAFTERDELRAFKAAEDSRKLTLPTKPEDYRLELSKDFKAPEGAEFKIDEKNPIYAQARQVMHDVDTGKLSGQEAFSKFLDLYAGAQIGSDQEFKTAINAEITKLGAAGPARVTAINTFLDAKGYGMFKPMLVSAEIIQGFEKLMKDVSSQGGAGFSQSGREGADTKPSEEEYASWSYGEKREYTTTGKKPERRRAA